MQDKNKTRIKRRELIIQTAIECFVEQGIHQTGIRDIAARADISLGNLYNHFSGKGELIAEIAALDGQGLAQFVEALQASDAPLSALHSFTDTYLDYMAEPDNAVLTIDIIAEAMRTPSLSEHFEPHRKALIKALEHTLTRGIKQGEMRTNIDVQEVVLLMLDAIEGLGLRMGLSGQKPSKRARKVLHQMIMGLVEG